MADLTQVIGMLQSGPETSDDFAPYAEKIINEHTGPQDMAAVCAFADALLELRRSREHVVKLQQSLKEAEGRSCDHILASRTMMIRQEKLAAIGQLAAGIAHELNNPIGYISGNFEALRGYSLSVWKFLGEISDLSPDNFKATLEDLKTKYKLTYLMEDTEAIFSESSEGFRRISGIVNNLLAFARQDGGIFRLSSLNSSVRTTAAIAQSQSKFIAAINLELSELPDFVFCPGEINQVLLNLILNSVQAIKSQNRHDEGVITVRTYEKDGYAVCSVQDDGPGVIPANIHRVFDPFFTTKPVGEGTGLGLNISYDIVVNRHKGTFELESEPGKTVFVFRLPFERGGANG